MKQRKGGLPLRLEGTKDDHDTCARGQLDCPIRSQYIAQANLCQKRAGKFLPDNVNSNSLHIHQAYCQYIFQAYQFFFKNGTIRFVSISLCDAKCVYLVSCFAIHDTKSGFCFVIAYVVVFQILPLTTAVEESGRSSVFPGLYKKLCIPALVAMSARASMQLNVSVNTCFEVLVVFHLSPIPVEKYIAQIFAI